MNEQRLFPFIGGLVLGGATSAAFSRPNYYYPSNYGYYYPQQVIYPYYYYQQPYNYQGQITNNGYNINTSEQQPTMKVVYESPTDINIPMNRCANDWSIVPYYKG